MINKVILLTGASEGIGKATALELARLGATLVLVARSDEKLQAVADAIAAQEGKALALPADVSEAAQREQIVRATLAAYGRVDVLINNAAVGLEKSVEETGDEDARYLFEVNFFAPLHLTQLVLPIMRRQGMGQIVNVSSIVGHRATPRQSIYCATKYALNGLSDSLRTELIGTGIVVTDIYPGVTATDFPLNMVQSTRTEGHRNATPPEKVATVIAQAIQKRQRARYVTWADQAFVYVARAFPQVADYSLGRGFGVMRRVRRLLQR